MTCAVNSIGAPPGRLKKRIAAGPPALFTYEHRATNSDKRNCPVYEHSNTCTSVELGTHMPSYAWIKLLQESNFRGGLCKLCFRISATRFGNCARARDSH